MADREQEHVYDADDEDPANLVANPQLQDANKSAPGKGKGRSGEFSSDSQASQQQQANLRYTDMRTAQGFENAAQTNEWIAMTTISPANIAVTDHEPACTLKGNPQMTDVNNSNANLRLQSKSQGPIVPHGYYQRTLHSDKSKHADSSTLGARRSAITQPQLNAKAAVITKRPRMLDLSHAAISTATIVSSAL